MSRFFDSKHVLACSRKVGRVCAPSGQKRNYLFYEYNYRYAFVGSGFMIDY